MATKGIQTNDKPELKVSVKDGRLPIVLEVETKTGIDELTLFFNPTNPFVLEHIAELQNTQDTKNDSDDKEFLKHLEYHFDGIFGKGSAREVFNYNGVDLTLISKVIEQAQIGVAWANKVFDVKQAQAKAELAKHYKAESEAFRASTTK